MLHHRRGLTMANQTSRTALGSPLSCPSPPEALARLRAKRSQQFKRSRGQTWSNTRPEYPQI